MEGKPLRHAYFKALLVLAIAAITFVAGCRSERGDIRKRLTQTTPARQQVARAALARIGQRYAAHADGPNAFSNAGLAYFAYHQNGDALPRGPHAQLDAGLPIALADGEPGDLVFFRLPAASSTHSHAFIAVGVLIDRRLAVMALPPGIHGEAGVRRIALHHRFWAQRRLGVARILPKSNDGTHS